MTDLKNPEIFFEHYQKSFELTYEILKERNRLFIYLVLAAGVGLLFLLRVPEFDKLLVEAIVSVLNIEDTKRIAQLYLSFPFDVFLSIILVIIFYLIQKLYSTNLAVLRYYLYLSILEDELRISLKLPTNSVFFTREGSFYWGNRTFIQGVAKWSYIFATFIVLLPFIYLKLKNDIILNNGVITIVDCILSILIIVFLWGYSQSAWRLDTSKLPEKSLPEINVADNVNWKIKNKPQK